MTLTGDESAGGSGGAITYNGVEYKETFRVVVGDSISCQAFGSGTSVYVAIYLNGTIEASKKTLRFASVLYTYTPTANATINRKITKNGNNVTVMIKITETP